MVEFYPIFMKIVKD